MARGSIKQRKTGAKDAWTIHLDVGKDPETGKRRRLVETIRGTKEAARRRLTELQRQLDTDSFLTPSNLTVGMFLEQWLRDYAETNVRQVTAEGYAQAIRQRIAPRIGAVPLAQLRPSHLQALYAALLKEGRADGKGGLSPRTVTHTHRVLKEALGHAVKWGLAPRNVADAVDPPRAGRYAWTLLAVDGLTRILEAVRGTVYYPIFHLAAHTGARRSELLGLHWRDLDLDMMTLSIVHVLHVGRGGHVYFEEPKSDKSRRMVDLTPASALVLREHRERQRAERAALGAELGPDDLVFARVDGSPVHPSTVSHAFGDVVKRLGMKGVRLHDSRHAHATLLLSQGVHPKIVQERLGHSTIAITLDTYSHVLPGLQKAAAQRFDDLFTSRETEPLMTG